MSKIKIITGVLSVCLTIPIWLYLFYKVMVMVQATELMWFLFWIYVPVVIVVSALKMVVEDL